MNQRSGNRHAAALSDRQDVALKDLIEYVRRAQAALEECNDEGAIRFELLLDFLVNDVANGKPLVFSYKSLGL